jgi:hypothetical protein
MGIAQPDETQIRGGIQVGAQPAETISASADP